MFAAGDRRVDGPLSGLARHSSGRSVLVSNQTVGAATSAALLRDLASHQQLAVHFSPVVAEELTAATFAVDLAGYLAAARVRLEMPAHVPVEVAVVDAQVREAVLQLGAAGVLDPEEVATFDPARPVTTEVWLTWVGRLIDVVGYPAA